MRRVPTVVQCSNDDSLYAISDSHSVMGATGGITTSGIA